MSDHPSPKNTNTSRTTESDSKAGEKPIPGEKPEGIVEPPAAKTREEAAKKKLKIEKKDE
jgi:hypothetical protein